MAIAKRRDTSPQEGKSKYGNVTYADPTNKKYPLDSETHVRAAWSYINMPKNAQKYSSKDVAAIKGRIKAAGKKYKIDFSNGDKSESSLVVMGSSTTSFDGEAPSQIIYMPKGQWKITPRVNGETKEVVVTVDENTATALQTSFEQRLSQPVRPIAGFDHKPGNASFIPKGFMWDKDKGVLLNVDWTKAGREAIEGRNYSYFSPTFLLNNNRVTGLAGRGEIGSLTNSPAFEDIERIAASSDPDDAIPIKTMTKLVTKLVELELITAEQGDDEDAVFDAIVHLNSDLTEVRAHNATLLQENETLRTEAVRVKGNEADQIIAAAISEGKIPSQNHDLIKYYRAQLIANPEGTKIAIKAMNPAKELGQVVKVTAGEAGEKVGTTATKQKLMSDQHAIVREIQAANPGMDFKTAWAKAKREHKHAFIEA